MRGLRYLTWLCCVLLLISYTPAQSSDKPLIANPALRQELLRRYEQDQAIRNEWIKKGVERPRKALMDRMRAIDSDNARRMREIVRQYGWPDPGLVGKDGSEAAFILIQHADHQLQKEMVPLVQDAYQAGKLTGQDYALLLDRVLVDDGKPQVYGTQARDFKEWRGQEPVLYPIEDEASVDKRRAEVGLPRLAEYLKFLKQLYFPKDKDK